jgi:hypothetical protein
MQESVFVQKNQEDGENIEQSSEESNPTNDDNAVVKNVNGHVEASSDQEESNDGIEIVQVIELKKPVTGSDLYQQYKELILSDFNDEEKIIYLNKIVKKVEEILEMDGDYLDTQVFLSIVEASMSDFLDCKTTEAKKIVLSNFFDELRLDNIKRKAKKALKEERMKVRAQYLEEKKINKKIPIPPILSAKQKVKNDAQIKKLSKQIVKLQKQHDKYEQKELSLDELNDDCSTYIQQTSIAKKVCAHLIFSSQKCSLLINAYS